jgi:enamidase
VSDLVLRNIGELVSGLVDRPLLDADTVVIRDGVIAQIGTAGTVDDAGISRVIDLRGITLAPGLIDSHVHPVLGDYTPRQNATGWIEGCLHGGVTTMISAGEVHTPGRPRDPDGALAMAVMARRAYDNLRPGGVKVRAGSLLLENGMTERHFASAAASGVARTGEIGVSSVQDPDTAAQLAGFARQHGMRVLVHTGGASVPGSGVIDGDFVLAVRPDVACHVNGGPTALPADDIVKIIESTSSAIELVQCGNVASLVHAVQQARAHGALDRVIVGTDMPSGTGVIPLGILRTVSWIAALGAVDGATALAMATGNTARVHGLACGVMTVGAPADLIAIDAPQGSAAGTACAALAIGDTPGVGAVITDGHVQLAGSRNTPPVTRPVSVPWLAEARHG